MGRIFSIGRIIIQSCVAWYLAAYGFDSAIAQDASLLKRYPLPVFTTGLPDHYALALKKSRSFKTSKEDANTIYVIHGGMSDPQNESPGNILKFLVSRGIALENIVTLPNPYPGIPPQLNDLPDIRGQGRGKKVRDYLRDKANEARANTLRNWTIYKQSTILDSEVTQTTYRLLVAELEARRKKAPDRPLKVVWIGLSAGGQMGLTMSELLAQNNPQLQFKTIVTLGSPILQNHAPASVRIISNISEQDEVLMQTTRPGYARALIGTDVQRIPPNLDHNDEVRTIEMRIHKKYNVVEGHNLWHRSPEILGKALKGVLP